MQRAAGGRHGRHLDGVTPYLKYLKSDAVNRWITIMPNFNPTRLEMMQP